MHLLQYVQGRSGWSNPRSYHRTRSGFAIRERAMATASQSPRSMASRITDARWKPPVQITGTDTACLMARANGRLMPSITGPRARAQALRTSGETSFDRNEIQLRTTCDPLDSMLAY